MMCNCNKIEIDVRCPNESEVHFFCRQLFRTPAHGMYRGDVQIPDDLAWRILVTKFRRLTQRLNTTTERLVTEQPALITTLQKRYQAARPRTEKQARQFWRSVRATLRADGNRPRLRIVSVEG